MTATVRLHFLAATVAVCAVAFVALASAEPARAAEIIVSNGKIAYHNGADGDNEIYTVNPDGTDQTQLTDNTDNDDYPSYSRDGQQIVFNRGPGSNQDVYKMDADGSNQTNLTNNPSYDFVTGTQPWSPDDSKILFVSDRDDPNYEIYVMNSDGTGVIRLTNDPAYDDYPSYSPDGAKIVFLSDRDGGDYNVWVMNADGTDPIQLTSGGSEYYPMGWSPDGTKILLVVLTPGLGYDVWVMNADGSNLIQLTNQYRANYASFAPDGTKIVFTAWPDPEGAPGMYLMSANGSGITLIKEGVFSSVSWQPIITIIPTPTPPAPDNGGARGSSKAVRSADFELPKAGPDGIGYAGAIIAAYGAYRLGRRRWDITRRRKTSPTV